MRKAKIYSRLRRSAIVKKMDNIEPPILTDGQPLPGHGELTAALQQSEEQFRLLVSAVKDYAIIILNPNGIISSWNEGAQRIKGYSAEEIIGQHFSKFYTLEDRASGRPEYLLQQALRFGRIEDEGWRVRKDGSRFWADVVITPVYDSEGRLIHFAKITRDLTERRRAEIVLQEKQKQIAQLQKLESVGRLAGGIAHDFNNLTAGISGCAEALLEMMQSPEAREEIVEIQKACQRAAALTRQLMGFSRRQPAVPKLIDMNVVVRDFEKMIRRVITATINLVFKSSEEPCLVKADVGQLEQVLMNLVLNARDAMPQGGYLGVQTGRVILDPDAASEFEIPPGEYIMLTISDTGVGMTPEVRARIFEPFFTTKEVGKGTGLGLATVYGIIKQNSGSIGVYSAPGVGTVLRIFFPAAHVPDDLSESGSQNRPEPSEDRPTGQGEIILVVEDDALVLRNTVRALQTKGYTVVAAADAKIAADLFQKLKGKIRLLITDVIMPEGNGKQLADQLKNLDPNLAVLFMSGYTADVIAQHGLLSSDIPFLEKPFSSEKLFTRVRELLNQTGGN